MSNRWLGHRLVEFGADMCQKCGNERLRHLHRVRLEDGTELEVGCVCAAKLCVEQVAEINVAEKTMRRQDAKLKLIADLQASWKFTRKKKVVERISGNYNGTALIIKWRWGSGWTVNLPQAPCDPAPQGYRIVMAWVEEFYKEIV